MSFFSLHTFHFKCYFLYTPCPRCTSETWSIPEEAPLPEKGKHAQRVSPLLQRLREEQEGQIKGGIYHRTQIDLTYNSNHIEGSRLTHDQTRYIFETNTIGNNLERKPTQSRPKADLKSTYTRCLPVIKPIYIRPTHDKTHDELCNKSASTLLYLGKFSASRILYPVMATMRVESGLMILKKHHGR